MSEEILKALMQLFAIIAKQDDGVALEEREYVRVFLSQQIDENSVKEYLLLFDNFAGITDSKLTDKDKSNTTKRTSVKDSVRILGICEKISETLTLQQKVVVLVRLFELLASTRQFTPQRILIIETASMVFNMDDAEYGLIKTFVTVDDLNKLDHPEIMLINDKEKIVCENCKHIVSDQLNGNLVILKIININLYFLRYTGTSNVFLNGLAINNKNIYLFTNGSILKVPSGKPLFYSDVAANFQADSTEFRISFHASNIQFKFPNGKIGLREVNLYEEQGKLIGIMGASGAGKTTLLNILAGLEKPSEGKVLINDIDIHSEKEKIEGVIGFIPQDDLLIEELTVFENLYFNAKLCFRNLSNQEITHLVSKLLFNLGLDEIKHLKVGNPLDKKISGGQRKRLNIGLEIIREPSVLFVDEPTSGLSSRDSENVMDLLRELALKGKLIFVVIHQPSSDIYKTFDKIVFLDTGGYLIYYGNPVKGITYFKKADNQINSEIGECLVCGTVSPEIIFNIVEAKVIDEFGRFSDKRRRLPHQWADLYKKNTEVITHKDIKEVPAKTLIIPSWVKQLKIFTTRDILAKISNKQYLLINLLETPVLAFILAYIIRYIDPSSSDAYIYRENDNIPSYIFMSIIVILFIGLTVSAEEIFRDRKILKRESFLNLSRSSYLFSKIGILFFLSAIQTLVFVLIGNSILGIRDMHFEYWVVLFSTSCLANIIGLNISAIFNSAVTIYIVIPLLIIPQMVLGGAMFSFDKLNKTIGGGYGVPFIAELMPSRWAFEALMVNQFVNNKFEQLFYDIEKKESMYDYKQVYFIPELIDIVNECKNISNINSDSIRIMKTNLLLLLENEISNQIKQDKTIKFNHLNSLNSDSFNTSVADSTLVYLKKLSKYNASKFNEVNMEKEQLIIKLNNNNEKKIIFRDLRNNYYNDYLSDEVKKKLSKRKIVRDRNRLIQIYDPIYRKPDMSNYFDSRTYFYAPNKQFMGYLYDTYIFNLIILWLMTVILYITLYYDFFRKVLSAFNKLTIQLEKMGVENFRKYPENQKG